MDKKVVLTCKCPACMTSEKTRTDVDLPYRYVSGRGQNIFHLSLWLFFVPAIGAILIGSLVWVFAPVISLIVAYIVNSFLFCASCSYHHENVRFCGCFPKSFFPYKRYKAWGQIDNIVGFPLILGLLLGPTVFLLAIRKDWKSIIIYLLFAVVIFLLQSCFSCPNCRQRVMCYIGKSTILIRQKQKGAV